MSKSKEALIIGTQVATADHESGASLRLQSVKHALEKSNFYVTVSPLDMADSKLTKHWDLIVVISNENPVVHIHNENGVFEVENTIVN